MSDFEVFKETSVETEVFQETLQTFDWKSAGIPDKIPEEIKKLFWKWFVDHQDDSIIKVKFLIFKIRVRVKHLKPIFELIFGPQN